MFKRDYLKQARESAENAVADMKDGELKVAAFSVILNRLLAETVPEENEDAVSKSRATKQAKGQGKQKAQASPKTVNDRILSLHTDGFFSSQRGLSEIQDELAKNGWHYPITTLSGAMQGLVGPGKELRRVHVAAVPGKKKKYSGNTQTGRHVCAQQSF